MSGVIKRLGEWLARQNPFLIPVALGLVLTFPSVFAGLAIDDNMQRATALGEPARVLDARGPFDLFSFLSGNPAAVATRMEQGMYPWYTPADLKLAFWRPLGAATLVFDYRMFPGAVWLMHLENLAWYALAIMLAVLLYRRFVPHPWAAPLAAVMFAVDEAHGFPVGWVASRNSVMAAVFGFGALWLHDRWRANRWTPGALLAPAAYAAGLLSAEAALAATAYLFAYAVFVDEAPWGKRLLALAPYAAVTLAWRAAYISLGYGTHGSSLYFDPLLEPGSYFAALPGRVLALVLGKFSGVPSEIWTFAGGPAKAAFGVLAALFTGWLALHLTAMVRADRNSRFWLLGASLSLLPVCATEPSGRLLFFAGLGFTALTAQWLAWYTDRPGERRATAGVLAAWMAAAALVLAPLALPPTTLITYFFQRKLDQITSAPLYTADEVRDKTVVVVSGGAVAAAYLWCFPYSTAPQPRACRLLYTGTGPLTIRRFDLNTLEIESPTGFLRDTMARMLRHEHLSMKAGDEFTLSDLTVRVISLNERGFPRIVRFTFPTPLEDRSRIWITDQDNQFVRFTPPLPGEQFGLGPLSFP